MKKIKDFLFQRIEDSRQVDDVYINNEIQSNMLVGKIVTVMMFLGVMSIVFGFVGIYHIPSDIFYVIIVVLVVVQLPIIIINFATQGHLKFARNALVWSSVLITSLFIAMYGNKPMLISIYPMLISIRYCDVKFTIKTVTMSIVLSYIAFCAYCLIGQVNLNVFYLEPPGIIFDPDVPIAVVGIDRFTYVFRLFLYDYLASLIAILIIGSAVISIAKHGKRMIEEESANIVKNARINTEINLAIEVQANMLAKSYPAFPNHPKIDLYALNKPAKEMGGDFYDFFKIEDNKIAIVMADVSGKGIGSAFFMAIANSALRYCVKFNNTPSSILENTNSYLCDNNESGLFVSCWLGIYNVTTHKLTYANAGHNAPILIRKGMSAEYIKEKPGLVLAGMDGVSYKDYEIDFNPGDEIVLYTDGVTEANDIDKKQYGEDRLLKEIELGKNNNSKEQIENIVAKLNVFMKNTEQFDDITMLVMKVNE